MSLIQERLTTSQENWFPLPLALSGWLCFQNFGMPVIMRSRSLCRSKHTQLHQLDRQILTLSGSALPSPKRLRAGRSKVLQENHPCGPGLAFSGILIFPHILKRSICSAPICLSSNGRSAVFMRRVIIGPGSPLVARASIGSQERREYS